VGLLLVDTASGEAVALDYGFTTERTTNGDGTLATVRVPFGTGTVPSQMRAYLMVDTYPAARDELTVP
jgi:hypothetical protein